MLQFRINISLNNNKSSYGINVTDGEQTVRQYADITDNFGELNKLCELCNSLVIDKCHIDDIIEDFLTDFKTY